jgi:hypothetical protein
MTWKEGDFVEELAVPQEEINEGYFCPWCKKETDIWFDRTIESLPDGTEIGMKDRCIDCGRATDDLPESDDYTFDVENDGG